MHISSVPFYFRILDYLMVPLMWVLLGFKFERPQETHKWHIQNITCKTINDADALSVHGESSAHDGMRVPQRLYGAYMHFTSVSKWKNYVILGAKDFDRYWHVGWKIQIDAKRVQKCQIQKLRIHTPYIKLLVGSEESTVLFFGVSNTGKQIPLSITGKGKIGDGKFRNVRLF